jgi:pyruvate dehydrogenase E2 component (dihydrolipoamide acetyltransferase)
MAVEVFLPKLGMMQTEGLLVKWLRDEGAQVAAGEAIAVVETDKADVELEAPADGRLVARSLAEGESAPVGTVIAYIAAPGETVTSPPPPVTSGGAAEPTAPLAEDGVRATAAGNGDTDAPVPKASPVARRLARELGVDLATVTATGPGGRVTEADVRAAANPLGVERPQSRARQVTAKRTALAFSTIPHLYLETTVDASALLEAVGDGVTVTDLLVYVVARSLRAHPGLNATFDSGKVIELSRVDIGLAVDTPEGLYVPVLPEADRLELAELSGRRAALVERARSGGLSTADLRDASFTITNLGVFDVDAAWPVINAPAAAILATGRIRREPVAVGEEVVVRPRMRLVLAADHRAVDGAQGGRFLGDTKTALESLDADGSRGA